MGNSKNLTAMGIWTKKTLKLRASKKVFFSCWLFVWSVLWGVNSIEAAMATKAVWSQKDTSGFNVYFSNSEETVALSYSGTNIAPMLHSSEGVSWVVWTRNERESSSVYLASINSKGKILTLEQIPTAVGQVFGPTVFSYAKDGQTKLWVAWTQFDGKEDDVFLTTNFHGEWAEAQRVTELDGYSDTLPMFRFDNQGQLLLSWYRSTKSVREELSLILEPATSLSQREALPNKSVGSANSVARKLSNRLTVKRRPDVNLLKGPGKASKHVKKRYDEMVGLGEVVGGAIEMDDGSINRVWPQ